MDSAKQIKTVIDDVLQRCQSKVEGSAPLPLILREVFDELER